MPDTRANINSARPPGGGLSYLLRPYVIFGRQSLQNVGRLNIAPRVTPTGESQMPYTYTLTSIIPATPQEIYDAWLDSLVHSEMTGGEASMSDEVGAEVSAWDEYIKGRNLELVPGERIVQSWRTEEFADEHADSIITVMLEETDDGTLLTLVHSNVPDEHKSYEEGGWQSNYFEPMQTYFGSLKGGAESKTGKKVRRVAGERSKKTTPRAKAASGRKAKRPVAKKRKAKPRPKVARPSRKKPTKSRGAKKKSKARRGTRR